MIHYENSVARNDEVISLQQFTNRLVHGVQTLAIQQNSLIVNDIFDEFTVNTDAQLLSTVISRLLGTVIGKSKDSCIRISAKSYHNVILFRINHQVIAGLNMYELKEIEAYAASLGGCITLNTQAKKGNAIIFSFIDHPIAA